MVEKIDFGGLVILFTKVIEIYISVVDEEEMDHFLVVEFHFRND
jgi:hypothetical protein